MADLLLSSSDVARVRFVTTRTQELAMSLRVLQHDVTGLHRSWVRSARERLAAEPAIDLGLLVALVMMAQLAIAFGAWQSADVAASARVAPIMENTLNTHALGTVLYDRYLLPFQLSGLILLVAMIGAILLTLRHRRDIKRQDVLQQMWRDPKKAMRMTNPRPGQGL